MKKRFAFPLLLVCLLLFILLLTTHLGFWESEHEPLVAVYVSSRNSLLNSTAAHQDNYRTLIGDLQNHAVKILFVDAYIPQGVGEGIFKMKPKGNWKGVTSQPTFHGDYDLGSLLEIASSSGIQTFPTICCFGGGRQSISPAEGLHAEHLLEIADYLVENFDLDGLNLDYIRYVAPHVAYGDTLSVTRFVEELRERIENRILSAAVMPPSAYPLEMSYVTTVLEMLGQDYYGMSFPLDYICPMTYHLNFAKNSSWVGDVVNFTRNIVDDNCAVLPIVKTDYSFHLKDEIAQDEGTGISFRVPEIAPLIFHIEWTRNESVLASRLLGPLGEVKLSTTTMGTFELASSDVEIGEWILVIRGTTITSEAEEFAAKCYSFSLPGYDEIAEASSNALSQGCTGVAIYMYGETSTEEWQAIADAVY